jgi:ribose transport system ATP-binding protein
MEPAIDAVGVSKVYGPTVALDHASLSVRRGEIHALLGENGAGKSTLVRILAGVEHADSGSIRLLGGPATGGVSERQARGCAFIHQDLGLFGDMTVAENVALVGGFARRAGLIRRRATSARARETISRLGLELDPDALVEDLSLADQTSVAVARALSGGVSLIVLDEPTAYLEARQARRLFDILGRLREHGVACLLITHRAEDVLATCDAFTVLRDGTTVATERVEGVSERDLVRMIIGHAPVAVHAARGPGGRESAVELRRVSGPGFRQLSLAVAAGETLGVCGLADAGHFAVGETIFGLNEHEGEIAIDGRLVDLRDPAQAIDAGIGFVPRDRRTLGLALELTSRENVYLDPHGPWHRLIRVNVERRQAQGLLERFQVRPADPEHEVATLSGGNQQKVLLAKWLDRDPRLLVLNEPTAGVDLGARAEIYQHIRRASIEDGVAVIVLTSDFVEVSEFCDRAIVMRHGSVVAEVDGPRLTSHNLTELAYGGAA